ncbi:MAG: hypothetical protein ACE5JG_09125 [Planctomycetota bacterium]
MRRLKKTPARCARRVTEMLRCMEEGRFQGALRALRRRRGGPVPPPHALWKLGRWCLARDRPRDALVPLRLFLDLYPNHLDRGAVLLDAARALRRRGLGRRAAELVREAAALRAKRHAVPTTGPVPTGAG